jgi:hypothetical protein
MCPTPIGRIHTRVAIIFLPAVLGTILSITTGREDWIVLIGVYLLLGVALDAGVYSWAIRYQPPWMTFVLALFEFGLLYTLAHILDLKLTNWEAVWFYWVSWALAISTKIVLLPLFSLTYLESAGEFRRIDWSIPDSQVPLPVLASEAEANAGPGPLVREASGVHATPPKRLPGPSAVHEVVDEMRTAGAGA